MVKLNLENIYILFKPDVKPKDEKLYHQHKPKTSNIKKIKYIRAQIVRHTSSGYNFVIEPRENYVYNSGCADDDLKLVNYVSLALNLSISRVSNTSIIYISCFEKAINPTFGKSLFQLRGQFFFYLIGKNRRWREGRKLLRN